MDTAVAPAPEKPAPSKFVIAVEGYERHRRGPKRQIWFYVTGFSYADGPGLKLKKVQYSIDRAKAKQFGKLDAETYSEQLNSRSFRLKTKVEPV
jgi:hypothetical protein